MFCNKNLGPPGNTKRSREKAAREMDELEIGARCAAISWEIK